jgi:hypothetical protein
VRQIGVGNFPLIVYPTCLALIPVRRYTQAMPSALTMNGAAQVGLLLRWGR